MACRFIVAAVFILALGQAAPIERARAQGISPQDLIGFGTSIVIDQMRRQQEQQAPSPSQSQQQRRSGRDLPSQRPRVAAPDVDDSADQTPDEGVKAIQDALNRQGLDAGPADGELGPSTQRAILAYQIRLGHAPTGVLTSAELASLDVAPIGAPEQDVAAFTMLTGQDLPGGDYRGARTDPSLRALGVNGCRAVCAADARCSGFTLDTRHDWCFLKTGPLSPSAVTGGAVSGVKRTVAASYDDSDGWDRGTGPADAVPGARMRNFRQRGLAFPPDPAAALTVLRRAADDPLPGVITVSARASGATGGGARAPANPDHQAMPATRRELIAEIQQRLTTLGYDPGPVDGQMGGNTEDAIGDFEEKSGNPRLGKPTRQLLLALRAATRDSDVEVAVGRRSVAAIAGGGAKRLVPGPKPSHADYVHLYLMGDREGFLLKAEEAGIAYLTATGSPAECQALVAASAPDDEFYQLDVATAAAARLRHVIDALSDRPSTFLVAQTGVADLGKYAPKLHGFPLQYAKAEFGAAGQDVQISNGKCEGYIHLDRGDDRSTEDFSTISAHYVGTPDFSLLPMSENAARALKASGVEQVELRAVTEISARKQGEGPLEARVRELYAINPFTHGVIYDFGPPAETAEIAAVGDAVPLDAATTAGLFLAARVAAMSHDQLREAITSYLENLREAFDTGNVPPGFPLDVADVRGKLAGDIYREHEDALLAPLTTRTVALPLEVTIEQQGEAQYRPEDRTVVIQGFPGHDYAGQDDRGDPFAFVQTSDRSRPVYNLIEPDRSRETQDEPYPEAIYDSIRANPRVELDRVVRVAPFPGTDEVSVRAADRRRYDGMNVVVRWRLAITGTRTDDQGVLATATLHAIDVAWADNGTPFASVDVAALFAATKPVAPPPGPAELAKEATAPGELPAGSPITAEIADLLQLRYLPDTVDDVALDRMMVARAALERDRGWEADALPWGTFFGAVRDELTPEARHEMAPAFRAWSLERAAKLPHTQTLRLPIAQLTPMDERGFGADTLANLCPTTRDRDAEHAEAVARRCAFLRKASALPEPVLYGDEARRAPDQPIGLRAECDVFPGGSRDDYCDAISRAEGETGARGSYDLVKVRRFPALTDKYGDDAVLELTVAVAGVERTNEPLGPLWDRALSAASAYGEKVGLGRIDRGPEPAPPALQAYLFDVDVMAARVVDARSGATLADLDLVDVGPADAQMLATTSRPAATGSTEPDIAGVVLGQSFAAAEAAIRAHMPVGEVLTRRRNAMQTAANAVQPFESGRMFVAEDGSEMVAIYDEPLVEAGRVAAVWRSLRVPYDAIDTDSLDAYLRRRYGAPRDVRYEERNGGEAVSYSWADVPLANERCREALTVDWRSAGWRTAAGTPFAPTDRLSGQPGLIDPYAFQRARDDDDRSALCPERTVVGFLRVPPGNSTTSGDEIITLRVDQQAYVDRLLKRLAPAEGVVAGATAVAE